MNIREYTERYLPLLEFELRQILSCPHEMLWPFYGMMQYHMGWLDEQLRPINAPTGKRIRPLLCLLACEAVGGRAEQAMPAAAAIEVLHNFSLIHDDIEDNSPTRRHRITVWKQWGLAHGINSGDGMFALAFLMLSHLAERGASAHLALGTQRIFTETCVALTEGQYLDMTFETTMEVSLDDYLWMIRNKTAALIACAAQLGALLGGGDAQTVAALTRFGENIGMAFQVIDDILGIWGDEGQTGKSTSSDLVTRKKTLPVIYALADPELRALYAQDSLSDQDVRAAIAVLERHGAREFAEQTAQEFARQAAADLDQADRGLPAHQALREWSSLLLKRTF